MATFCNWCCKIKSAARLSCEAGRKEAICACNLVVNSRIDNNDKVQPTDYEDKSTNVTNKYE